MKSVWFNAIYEARDEQIIRIYYKNLTFSSIFILYFDIFIIKLKKKFTINKNFVFLYILFWLKTNREI